MPSIFETISKKTQELVPQFIDEDKFKPAPEAGRALESARILGEETRKKAGGILLKAAQAAPKAVFGIFEGISRTAGALVQRAPGILQVPKEEREPFIPQQGDTLMDVIRRQPLFGEVVRKKVEETPAGKVPGVAVAAGFLSEFLLPPYGPKGGNIVDDLAKITSKVETKGLLLKGLKDISEKEADNLAVKLAPITDKKIIKQELENFVAQKPIPYKLTEKAVSSELQPLAQEARKPFSAQEQDKYNNFTHFPKDFNKEYANIVNPIVEKVETTFGKNVPEELRTLLDEHSKRAEQFLRAEGERMIKAPPPTVVGPANYNVSRTQKANRAFEKVSEDFSTFERKLESKINQLVKEKSRAEFSALSEVDKLKENIASVERQIARMNPTRDEYFIEKMTKQKKSLEKKLSQLTKIWQDANTAKGALRPQDFKSAEEYVKSRFGDQFGSYYQFSELKPRTLKGYPFKELGKEGTTNRIKVYRGITENKDFSLNNGDYVSLNRDVAIAQAKGGKVKEFTISPNQLLYDTPERPVYAVFNPDNLSPKELKSQLTKIWEEGNQVTKGADDITTSISKAKASGQSFDEWVNKESFNPNSRLEYHLSDNPNLVGGKTFAEQIKPSNIGERGFAGKEENIGQIFSTKNPQQWSAQLNFEGNKKPQYVYLVEVKNPAKVDIMDDLPHQSINSPQDVKILKKVGGQEAIENPSIMETAKRSQLKAEWDGVTKGEVPTDLAPTRNLVSKVDKSIEQGVQEVIPKNPPLKAEVSQELANSRILSSLPSDKQIPVTKSIAKEFSEYKKAQEGIKGLWTTIREKVQDSFIRARKLQQSVSKGDPIPENIDIDQARTLFDGRVAARLEDVKDVAKTIDKDIVSTAKSLETNSDELAREVDSFLHARHALERNAKLGDGAAGLTNDEAKVILETYKKSPHKADIDRIANQISELNSQTLKVLLDGEVIDQELFNLLTKTYKNHIPLQRVMSETDDIVQVLSGKGFDVKGTGLRKAVGSDRPVADILTNVAANLEQATIRAEKNLVDLTTLRFARANKELGIFEEIKPKAIGETFEKEGTRRIITERIDDPTVLALREKGKPVFLKINDQRLAVALKGVNVEKIPSLLKGITSLTRLYAGLHTRFNYEFAFSNSMRDMQEMAVYMASRKETGFGGATKALTKQPESVKAVFDFLRGADTEGSKLYKQMKLDGGTTGGLGLSTREQVSLDIEAIRKLNRSKPRQAAEKVVELVDKWNIIFEDSTRLSVYKAALDKGLSRGQAAVLAKEATLNFNKKGTAGPLINGLYMFSNASIQGTTKMLKALKDPKVLGAVTASLGTAIYAANEWNDNIDPDWRDKVTKWDRSSNLVVMLPSEEGTNYLTLPISWGLKPIKVALEYGFDITTGHGDLGDAVQGITTSVLEAYNPLAGDENILITVTPSILKAPMQISQNRAWYGSAIKPDYDPNVPASSKYFKSLENTLVGRTAISATAKLSEATKGAIEISPEDLDYAFTQYIGGAGRSVTKLVNTITAISKGEELEKKEIPILSRFLKGRDEEETLQSLYYSEKEKVDKEAARQKVNDVRRITPMYEEAQMLLSEGNEKEARVIVNNLSDEDYEIYKKMKASDKRRATSAGQVKIFPTVKHVQDLLKQGNRAEAKRIVDALTDEEYKAYQAVKKQLGIEKGFSDTQTSFSKKDLIVKKENEPFIPVVEKRKQAEKLKEGVLDKFFKADWKEELNNIFTENVRRQLETTFIPRKESALKPNQLGEVGELDFGASHQVKFRRFGSPKEQILLNEPTESKLLHEFIHAIVARTNYNFESEAFNRIWEESKKNEPKNPIYNDIDKILKESGLYEKMTDFNRANERFSYLAEFIVPTLGRKAIPFQFQDFYEDILQ